MLVWYQKTSIEQETGQKSHVFCHLIHIVCSFSQEALTSRDKDGTGILRQLYVFISGGQVDLDL
jgi:hypothetical protein